MDTIASFSAHYKDLLLVLHVLSVVVGMGGAFITDLLFIHFAFNKKFSYLEVNTVAFLSRAVTFALCCIILTGICIFASDIEKYSNSAKFLTKMTVVSVLCLNGYLLHRVVFKHLVDDGYLTKLKQRSRRKIAFALGAVSVVSWISAMSLGVLDRIPLTFDIAVMLYAAILVVSVAFSQVLCAQYEKM